MMKPFYRQYDFIYSKSNCGIDQVSYFLLSRDDLQVTDHLGTYTYNSHLIQTPPKKGDV